MKQLRLISVTFDTEIAPYETPAFRGAVIEKVGYEREHYHNHNNDPEADIRYHYRYPLVQYKLGVCDRLKYCSNSNHRSYFRVTTTVNTEHE